MSALPSPYLIRREIDRMGTGLAQQIGRLYTPDQMAQQHASGVAEGWRQARGWLARNTGALIAFGVCIGITLAVVLLPAMSWWLR